MIVQIKVRGANGKYRNACALEFAVAAFDQIFEFNWDHGWEWMRDTLAKWCLKWAESCSVDPSKADAWIARYQAIRGIR